MAVVIRYIYYLSMNQMIITYTNWHHSKQNSILRWMIQVCISDSFTTTFSPVVNFHNDRRYIELALALVFAVIALRSAMYG